jgi:hypothetical protein
MASIVWADVTNHAPALTTIPVAVQTDILAHVNVALRVDDFGGEDHPKTKLARIFLAAHYGTSYTQASTGQTGPVTSESAGGLSRSYGQMFSSNSPEDFASTVYGQLYTSLVRTSAARVPLVL